MWRSVTIERLEKKIGSNGHTLVKSYFFLQENRFQIRPLYAVETHTATNGVTNTEFCCNPHQDNNIGCRNYRQEILTSELEREKLLRFSHIAYAYVGKTK